MSQHPKKTFIILSLLISLSFLVFNKTAKAQSELGEAQIDSIISSHGDDFGCRSNYLVFFIKGPWYGGKNLFFLDMDTGYLHSKISENSEVNNVIRLSRRKFEKIKSNSIGLHGNDTSIIEVEDGCEIRLLIFKKNHLEYAYYMRGDDGPELLYLLSNLMK